MAQADRVNVSQARPDVALLLDDRGVIRKATLSQTLAAVSVEDWIGQPWFQTVGEVEGDKIRRMLEEAVENGVSAFRQLTQRFPTGLEMPMEYTTVRLDTEGRLLAVGKNLQAVADLQSRLVAAQQAMERDYWQLRYLETRYRLVLDASSEAVIMVRASNLRIIEANPAATRALGLALQRRTHAEGIELLDLVNANERDNLEAMLLRVRDQGKAPAIMMRLGEEQKSWFIRASLITTEQGLVFLLQLAPVSTPQPDHDDRASVSDLIERSPDAFVAVDADGMILCANQAFLELIQTGAKGSVVGECLGRWLGRPGACMKVLLSNVARHGRVRLFPTIIHGELGITTEVEVSAVGEADGSAGGIGLIIRDVASRLPAAEQDRGLGSIVDGLTDQIGYTPLPKLVKDTVGAVERHYIEAALKLTGDNRTAAAELLGLSRQSLYAKLNRYRMDGRGRSKSNYKHDE